MTLSDFVKIEIDKIMVKAAKIVAAEAETPDDAAAIPMAFFVIEQRLHDCWDNSIAEFTGQSAQQRHPADRGLCVDCNVRPATIGQLCDYCIQNPGG